MSTLTHPYKNLSGGQWLRGNLHAHTDRTDGQWPLQLVLDEYAQREYDFLMISDHDLFTSSDDYALLDAKGMILIPGNEITGTGPDLLHVGGGSSCAIQSAEADCA
jgi:predicted metal-dependent phosphoesterase TrpH